MINGERLDHTDLQNSFLRDLNADTFKLSLGSDNHSGAHPRILAAISRVNQGYAPSYGTDSVTKASIEVFRQHFGSLAEVAFCFNGTAANVIALGALIQSHNAVLASEHAHINVDECGAPEKQIGCKLISVATGESAKLTPALLAPHVIRGGDQHFSQVKAVSITQPTELGTIYSQQEWSDLIQFCRSHKLLVHVDGARLANAAVQTKQDFKELVAGADVVSFGGTKNGLIMGEAVIFLSDFARARFKDFPFYRKQLMQLPSKTRFIAAQFLEYLGTDLWKQIASHSCLLAGELSSSLAQIPEIKLTQQTQSNAVFLRFPFGLESKLREAAFFYIWNEHTRECRLMTSWCTARTDIEQFVTLTRELVEARLQARP